MLPVNLNSFSTLQRKKSLPKLTPAALKIIERSTVFKLHEKIDILQLFLGKKWVTDVSIDLERKQEYINELEKLKLPWAVNAYEGDYKCQWIQAGANQAVLEYVMQRKDNLSELEAGILYGYPLTHALAFTGAIKEIRKPPVNVATYMLAGVYSADFYQQEVAFFQRRWDEIGATSPVLAQQAHTKYAKFMELRDRGEV